MHKYPSSFSLVARLLVAACYWDWRILCQLILKTQIFQLTVQRFSTAVSVKPWVSKAVLQKPLYLCNIYKHYYRVIWSLSFLSPQYNTQMAVSAAGSSGMGGYIFIYLSEACGLGRSERTNKTFFFIYIISMCFSVLSFRYPPCHGIPRGPLFPFSSPFSLFWDYDDDIFNW